MPVSVEGAGIESLLDRIKIGPACGVSGPDESLLGLIAFVGSVGTWLEDPLRGLCECLGEEDESSKSVKKGDLMSSLPLSRS